MLVDSPRISEEVACTGRPATIHDLNESGYLQANPDVAVGGLSPREHYLACGQTEGRLQAINTEEVSALRETKLARVNFRDEKRAERAYGEAAWFLSDEIVAEFGIPDSPPVSAHPYPDHIVQLIRDNRDKLFLDVGAGLRDVYFGNVVNTEIYPSVSTDVVCIGETLPFADNQFDFVFCFATLEHTRRPWDVAQEICRVLRPGGRVIIDYPFMQPVHGYPHHYFNATPMGNQRLFEGACDISSVEIGRHQHPIIGLQWMLTVFHRGLPESDANDFADLRIKDILDGTLDALIDRPYSRNLHPNMQRVIASGSMLEAVKRYPSADPARRDGPATRINQKRVATAAEDLQSTFAMKQNELLKLQMETILNSTSWRITAPLRHAGRILRGK
jgi:SAM-dependent methyltransferase